MWSICQLIFTSGPVTSKKLSKAMYARRKSTSNLPKSGEICRCPTSAPTLCRIKFMHTTLSTSSVMRQPCRVTMRPRLTPHFQRKQKYCLMTRYIATKKVSQRPGSSIKFLANGMNYLIARPHMPACLTSTVSGPMPRVVPCCLLMILRVPKFS